MSTPAVNTPAQSTPRDPVRRKSGAAERSAMPHLESYVSSQAGNLIHVACVCRIGRPHSYEEWKAVRALRPAGQRPRLANNDST
jgi:hypothetical protein